MNGSIWAAAHQARMAHAVHGLVSAVDPENHAVKVRLQPDNIETGWLPDAAVTQVGDLRIACPCAPGSHVLLMPVEGDGETYIIIAVLFDVVAGPPVSPQTGKVAQHGELLIQAGCGTPSGRSKVQDERAGWLHLGRDGVFFGMGEARCLLEQSTIVLRLGSTEMTLGESALTLRSGSTKMTLDARGLTVSGGDIQTDMHTLADHVHPYTEGMTGKPVG